MADDSTGTAWWEKRSFPDCIAWDVVEAATLVVVLFVAFEVAKNGYPDGYDYRYKER